MRSWPDVKIKGGLPFGPELELSKGVAENQLTLPEEQGEAVLFSCGAGHKLSRESAMAPGEICKDRTLGLRIRPDCGGEIDRNYN